MKFMVLKQPLRLPFLILWLATLAGSVDGQVSSTVKSAQPYADNLSVQTLKKHLEVLAHDSLEGREAGTPGHENACEYLIRQYKMMGIAPLPGTNNYRQTASFPITKWSGYECRIRDVKERRYLHGRDFYMLAGTRMPNATALTGGKLNVKWAGLGLIDSPYGISNAEAAASTDQTLWLLVDTTSNFPKDGGSIATRIAGLRRKAKGPIMIVTTRFDFWQQRIRNFWDEPAHGFTAGRRGMTPVMVCGPRMGRMLLRKATENGLTRYWQFFQSLASPGNAVDAFGNLNLEALINIWAQSVADNQTSGWPCLSAADTVRFSIEQKPTTYQTSNVAAYIPGKKDKEHAVVLSAHSDHIGRDCFDVYNGADDDGTGTAALLTMAEQYAKAAKEGNLPDRTIIFMHFTAEEKGLLGSEYYGKNPLWPMEKVIVDLNVDMIGRSDDKNDPTKPYVYSIGSDKLNKDLKALHEEINTNCCNLTLNYFYDRPDDKEHLYERSDHYNFAKYGVPVIFYFSGIHPDYHGVNDHVERIEWDNYLTRTRLIFNTAWTLGNRKLLKR